MMKKTVISFMALLISSLALQAAEQPLYKDAGQPLETRVTDLLDRMTLEEKVQLITGDRIPNKGIIGSVGIPRLDIPNFKIEHGPYAFKGWFIGEGGPKDRGTYFPVSIAQAATWDRAMVERINAAMGAEMKASGGQANAGPAMNIIRDPRGGRSFEYFTEDPYLNGEIAVAYTKGLQSQKVMVNLKHFICNNQEFNRHGISVVVGERALREIYLPGFKAAIQDGDAWSVMGAYNLVNGIYCCEDPFILTDILRKDWGFKGFVLSDWGGTHSTAGSANAGLDMEMPRENWYGKKLLKAVADGEVTTERVDFMTGNLLRGMFWSGAFDIEPSLDKSILRNPAHLQIAREAAAQSTVLLKNKRNVLPFDQQQIKKIAVIGPNGNFGSHYNNGKFDTHLLQGGGSAYVSANQGELITAFQGIKSNVEKGIEVVYAPGCYAEDGCGAIPSKYLRTPDGQSEGLLASYFNSADFSGEPAKTEVDPTITHMWKAEIPIPEAGRSTDDGVRFSVVWTGTLHPPVTRRYTFSIRNYSGMAKLYVDGKEVAFNKEGNRMDWNAMASLDLEEGKAYEIRAEYVKIGDKADFRLGWDYENVQWMKEAVALAKASDAVVLTVGLSGEMGETEAGDRKHLRLFPAQEQLIREVAHVNPNSAVALIAGSAVDMRSWMDDVPAILMAWYPGQQGGNGLADVLFGKADPSGRLPITFPTSLGQYPAGFHSLGEQIEYTEGVFVGYRYFDEQNLKPLFPFGYGLSYTTVEYGEVTLDKVDDTLTVSLDITNTGKRPGAEVVQLYVHDVECSVPRPKKELKAFEKVFLNPGETKTVTLELDSSAFSFFSEKLGDWVVEPGEFEILIGSSSRDIRKKISHMMK